MTKVSAPRPAREPLLTAKVRAGGGPKVGKPSKSSALSPQNTAGPCWCFAVAVAMNLSAAVERSQRIRST